MTEWRRKMPASGGVQPPPERVNTGSLWAAEKTAKVLETVK